jgi:drug/metabolite transporter (DMT)-like permease
MSLNVFLLVLLAAALHAVWNYAARKAQGDVQVIWLGLFAASLFASPVILGLLVSRGWTGMVTGGCWGFVVSTGFLHAAYFLVLASAYRTGELSVVYPLSRGTGVGLTAVLAPLLFREPVALAGLAGVASIVLGVFLLGGPARGGGVRSRGGRRALGVGVIIAAYSLTDKGGVARADPIVYIWLMSLICVVLMAPFVLAGSPGAWMERVRRYGREILIIGIGSMGTYLVILYAFSLGPVGYVVAVRELSVVVGSLLGFVFLREAITGRKVVAIVLVVAGVVLIKLS